MNSGSTRRVFLIRSTIGGLSLLAARAARSQAPAGRLHVAASQWPWTQFYRREGRDFRADLDAGLAEVARSGVQGYEPGASGPEDVVRLAPLLKKHGLEMRSLYMNSLLHKADEVEKSIAVILATAERARAAGARIIVINPSPIRWGGPEDKDDDQFVWPYEKRLVDGIHAMGARVRLHICGNTRHSLASIGRLGCDMVDLDWMVPVTQARKEMGPAQVLAGNIDPVRVLRNGTPAGVTAAITACHRDAAARYIVGAGCEVPRDTPIENVRAMCAYARSTK